MATQENAPEASLGAGAIRSAAELSPGDRVVYPNQGVCRITGRESKEIAGQKLELIAMAREEDGAAIFVPFAKVPSIGLRKVADRGEVDDVFDLLASSFDDPELDWKVRHRTHGDLLMAGGVLGVAEVLKGLQALGNLRPLPQKERERYDAARHLLVHEMAVALGVPHCTAEDFIDLALIPPPGTERPARKPRRLAPLPPPRPRPGFRRPGPALAEDELGLDEELEAEEEEEIPAAAETEEGGGEEEAEEEAPAPAPSKPAPKAPAAARKPAPAKAAPPAKPAAAEKPAPAKAAPPAMPARPAPAEKPAPAKAPAAEKPAPAKAPAAEKPAPARAPAEKRAPSKAAPPARPAAAGKPAPARKAAAKKPAAKKATPRPTTKKPAAKKPSGPAPKKKR